MNVPILGSCPPQEPLPRTRKYLAAFSPSLVLGFFLRSGDRTDAVTALGLTHPVCDQDGKDSWRQLDGGGAARLKELVRVC